MSVTNLDLSNTIPDIFVMEDPQTGTKSIMRKQLMEVNAVDRVEFKPETTNQIRIKKVSPGDFEIGSESFIKMTFKVVATDNDYSSLINKNVSFPLGGVHNAFSRIQARTLGRGVLLQEVDFYNEYQAIEHLLNMDKDWIAQFGPIYGERSIRQETLSTRTRKWSKFNYTTGSTTAADRGITFTYTARNGSTVLSVADQTYGSWAALQTALQAGDLLRAPVPGAATNFAFYEVLNSHVSATNILLKPLNASARATFALQNINGTFNANTYALFIYRGVNNFLQSSNDSNLLETGLFNPNEGTFATVVSAGNAVASGAYTPTINSFTFTYVFKPMMSVADLNLPLFLLKDGIEWILDLNTAARTFIASNATNLSFEISDVKYMCMMVTPHPNIQSSYEQMWRSKKGLIYRIPSVRVKRQSLTHAAGQTDVQWHVGCRSAQKAILKQSDNVLFELPYYDCTMSHPCNAKSYQFMVGSTMYPLREVELQQRGEEAFYHLLQSFDRVSQADRILLSFDDYYYSSDHTHGLYHLDQIPAHSIRESTRFYIGVDFRKVRGYGENLSGVDLMHVPLELRIARNGATNQHLGGLTGGGNKLQLTLFTYYDCYMDLSAEMVAILS